MRTECAAEVLGRGGTNLADSAIGRLIQKRIADVTASKDQLMQRMGRGTMNTTLVGGALSAPKELGELVKVLDLPGGVDLDEVKALVKYVIKSREERKKRDKVVRESFKSDGGVLI